MLLAANDQSTLSSQLLMFLPLLLIVGMMFMMFRSRKKVGHRGGDRQFCAQGKVQGLRFLDIVVLAKA